jgi:hypothetical protein
MASPDPERRSLAASVAGRAGLLESASVRASVSRLAADAEPSVRLAAAAALAPHDAAALDAWVAALHADADSARLALEAAAGSPAPCFVTHLVDLAARPSAPEPLLDALVAHAEHLAPSLSDPALPTVARQRVVHALGEAGTDDCRAALVAHVNDGDPDVAEAAARALAITGHRHASAAPEVAEALAGQAVRAHHSLQLVALLDGVAGTEPLADALRDEVAIAARRAEVLLGLTHEPRVIGAGMAGLASDSERARNTALEMLEVTVGRPLARMLQALTSPELNDATRRRLLGEYGAAQPAVTDDWLAELVLDEAAYWREPWLRACALHAAPAVVPGAAPDLAARFTADGDPVVAETARWVLARTGA